MILLDAAPLPDSIRAILRLSGAEKGIKKLQRDFELWAGLMVATLMAGLLTITSCLFFENSDVSTTRVVRIILVIASSIDFLIAYFLYRESCRRYRYFHEMKKISSASKSFKDIITSFLGR